MIRLGTRVLVPAIARSLAVAVALVISALAPAAASADPFDGKIVTSDKRIPTTAKSKSDYFSKLRKQSKSEFWEDTKTKAWKIHFAAFFKKPLNDLEVTIKLYDETGGGRRLLAAFEQYLDGRGQKTVTSYLTLEREKVGVNRKVVMTMENRGRVLATGRFKILGQAEKYSGKVEFSQEEASQGAQE